MSNKLEQRNITDKVLARYREIEEIGIDIPKDFSVENALKAAWFELQKVKDKNEKPALQTCSQDSIANSLLEMVISGLNPIKKQCYFVAFGNSLTLMKSYQGNIALAKRYSGVKSVIAREIYKGDTFITEVLKDGREILVKHEQPFENTDNEIIGGYAIVVDKNDNEHLTKMTKKKIISSWNMGHSKGKGKFHTEFTDEAVKRTLYNRACKPYINSSNDENIIDIESKEEQKERKVIDIEHQEVKENKAIKIKEKEKKEPETKKEPNIEKPPYM